MPRPRATCQNIVVQVNTGNEFGIVRMNFAARNLPSISPPGLAALGALLVLGAGYAYRRRIG